MRSRTSIPQPQSVRLGSEDDSPLTDFGLDWSSKTRDFVTLYGEEAGGSPLFQIRLPLNELRRVGMICVANSLLHNASSGLFVSVTAPLEMTIRGEPHWYNEVMLQTMGSSVNALVFCHVDRSGPSRTDRLAIPMPYDQMGNFGVACITFAETH